MKNKHIKLMLIGMTTLGVVTLGVGGVVGYVTVHGKSLSRPRTETHTTENTQDHTTNTGNETLTNNDHNNTTNHKDPMEKAEDKTASNNTPETLTQHNSKPLLVNQNSDLKHILTVRPQVQKVWYWCAPTTVSMMLSTQGINVDQSTLAREMGTFEPYGTHNKDAIRILNKHMFGYEEPMIHQNGYRLESVTDVGMELPRFKQRLIQNIKDGYPMYYTLDVSKVYPGRRGEHNVIGVGYKLTPDKNDIEYLYYLDPYPALQDPIHGSLKIITPRELLNATLTCDEPNYAW